MANPRGKHRLILIHSMSWYLLLSTVALVAVELHCLWFVIPASTQVTHITPHTIAIDIKITGKHMSYGLIVSYLKLN